MNGTFRHNIDAKGRLFVPAKLREELGERFYVTKGLDNCLFVYPEAGWGEIEEKLKNLPLSRARRMQRMFFANAEYCTLDAQGRIVVPMALREHASLEKEVAIIGVGSRAEIWNAERWDRMNEEYDAESMAEDMDKIGF